MKQKNPRMKLQVAILLIILISVIPFPFLITPLMAQEQDPIGYRIYDNVVEIWNPDTTYYFDKTSGIQWSEDPDQYWSRNIFAVGYYSGGVWHKIYSADDLGTFNREIDSDYSTYVNATLWKDFEYNGYDLRLGVRYHLKLDDTDLSVIIYVKNIGEEDYPVPLGFAWIVTDIDIPNQIGEDEVYLNQTYYRLDETYDVTFTDIKQTYFVYTDPLNPEEGEGEWATEYLPNYRISDYTQFMTLNWNPNIPYSVRLQFNGIQEDARITWMVNAGIFASGQEKSTTLLWADAEGDYVGTWATNALNGDPRSITTDDTNIWITDIIDNKVYKYNMTGGYINCWALTGLNANPHGITTDGTNIWVVDYATDSVYKYNMAGGYIDSWIAQVPLNVDPIGITTDGTNIWIVDFVDDDVYKYDMVGNYIGVWSPAVANADCYGISHYIINFWLTDYVDNKVYKYNMTGGAVDNWALNVGNTDARGITTNGTYIWVIDFVDDAVYIYEGTPNFAPVNDECTITDLDDGDNVYAQISGGYTIDYDGYDLNDDVDYVLVNLTQGAVVRVSFKYTDSSDTFSIIDGDTEFTIDGSSSASRIGIFMNLTIVFHAQWDAIEEANLDIVTFIYDSYGENDTDTLQYSYLDVVTNLLCGSIESTDPNNPDRVGVSTATNVEFSIFYANDPASAVASAMFPPDAEFTSVSVYDVADNNEGTDNSIVNGIGSVAVTVPAGVGTDDYNIYIDMVDADYVDGEETLTEEIISDRIMYYWEQLHDSRVNISSDIQWRIRGVLDYDDHVIGVGDSVGSTWGALAHDVINAWWELNHTSATVDGLQMVLITGTEVTYDISAIAENITETTGVFDRFIVLTIQANNTTPLVNEYVLINCTMESEYDAHTLGVGDTLNFIASIIPPSTWNIGTGAFEEEEVRGIDVLVDYDLVTIFEATYGISAVNMDGLFVRVIWGNVNVTLTIYFMDGIDTVRNNDTLRANGTSASYFVNSIANISSTVNPGFTFFKYEYDGEATLMNPFFLTMDGNYTCTAYTLSEGGNWNFIIVIAVLFSMLGVGIVMRKRR